MKLQELEKKYYMHDSYFEKVEYNEQARTALTLVNFAFWMQDWYDDKNPENGILRLEFANVETFNYTADVDKVTQGSIIRTEIKDDMLVFAIYDDVSDEYSELSIRAEDVVVEEYAMTA